MGRIKISTYGLDAYRTTDVHIHAKVPIKDLSMDTVVHPWPFASIFLFS